jgi:hypothetical protein
MKGRSLLVLSVLTIGILVYVYYGIQKPAEKKIELAEKENALARGKLDKIEWIQITTGTESFRLDRQNEGWKISSPLQDLAAQSKIETLISAIEKTKKMKTLIEKDELEKKSFNKTQYGLQPVKLKVEYKTSDLPKPYILNLGDSNPAATGIFFETEDMGIGLGSMELDYLNSQTSKDFREMRLTTVSAGDFDEVSITSKNKTMKLKRDNGEWKMLQPFQLPLDQEIVNNFVEKIGFIRATEFLSKPAPSLSNPDIRIVVGFKQGIRDGRSTESDKRPQGLELLLSKVKADYYAKSDKTPAASIIQYHYDNFLKNPEELVRRSFDRFMNADVQEILAHELGKKPRKLVRSTTGFTIDEGQGPHGIQTETVNNVLNALRTFKPSKFVKQSAIPSIKSSLKVQVTLKSSDNKNKHVIFVFVVINHTFPY